MDYSTISKELTNKLSKIDKKNNGIYFTPPSCIYKNLQFLQPYIFKQGGVEDERVPNIINVLEPSCGSGEYITALSLKYPHLKITGIELNKTIYDSIKTLASLTPEFSVSAASETPSSLNSFVFDSRVSRISSVFDSTSPTKINIINTDFLKYNSDIKYDLIIGNPPYYVMKKEDVHKKYYSFFEGRPNIFILFIIKSLEMLNENGILSFVLPKNFLNCLYYDKTRRFINKYFKILNIIDCSDDKYIETQQDTVIFIIQSISSPLSTPPLLQNSKYVFVREVESQTEPISETRKSTKETQEFVGEVESQTEPISETLKSTKETKEFTIFITEKNHEQIKELYKNSKSLVELDFRVSVGNVVWNQCKKILTNDPSKTRLIYASDVHNNSLIIKKYNNEDKKNYINKPGINRPMIIINRGYGVGEYNFNFCLIDEEKEYLIENHLICIESKKKDISREILLESYKNILRSLNDERTKQFIKLYFGNNAINTIEINNILPIYQDI